MTQPIRQLSPELVQENPALQAFSDFVQEKTGQKPPPEKIQVFNAQAQDGFIDLRYVGERKIIEGRLDAHDQRLQLHFGIFKEKKPVPTFEPKVEKSIAGTCQTVRALGGELESGVLCSATPNLPRDRSTEKMLWYLGGNIPQLALVEGGWRLAGNKGWWTRAFIQSLRDGAFLEKVPGPTVWQRVRELSSVGIGLGAMALSQPLANALGMHPRDERFERDAMALGMGYGAYRLSRGIGSVFGKRLKHPAASFGTSLLLAGMVNSSVGRFWDEGSSGRTWSRNIGFFAPAMLRSFQGARRFGWMQQKYWKGFSKWSGRAMVAGFAADVGYMAYNHYSKGHAGAVLQNRLYARANRLHDQEANPVTLVAKGYCSFVAPALTERLFVPSSLVEKSREEMLNQDLRYVTSLENDLRRQVGRRLAQSQDPKAWENEAFWQFLREDLEFKDFMGPEGRELPLEVVAEQLAHPKVRERLAGKSEDEVRRYVQHQFRGYRLSVVEAEAILERLDQVSLKSQLSTLEASEDSHLRAMRGYFDSQGHLLPGAETSLMQHLFPDPFA